jgi:hypothetical protein
MRTLIVSLAVAALVIGSVWVFTPSLQAFTQNPDTDLQYCQLSRPLPFCGLMTRLDCQNAGGKVVEKCVDPGEIK